MNEFIQDLIKAGVHFGHHTARWNPKMAPYVWGSKSSIHLVDVSKTAFFLERAAKFLETVAADGKQILWVGSKKAAQETITDIAKDLNMPYVSHRWVGGTLTNYPQVKKSVTKMLHFEDVVSRASALYYTKKEILTFQKNVDRLQKNVGGIRALRWPIGAVVIVDVRHEDTAVDEAVSAGIPLVALVDTNCDPTLINYVIPGNDDSPRAIKIIMQYLAQAAKRGLQKAEELKKAGRIVEKSDAQGAEDITFATEAEAEEDRKSDGKGRVFKKAPVK